MKRILALLVSLLMTLMCLSGCTSAEGEYLELSQEIAGLQEWEFNGTARLDIDLEALANSFLSAEYGDEEQGISVRAELPGGKREITIAYSGMNCAQGQMISATGEVNGSPFDLGTIYMKWEGEIILSKQTLFGVLDLIKSLDGREGADCYAYSKEYREALEQRLAEVSYLGDDYYVGDEELMPLQRGAFQALTDLSMGGEGLEWMEEYQDAFMTFLLDAHRNYSSGLVRKIGNTYELQMTLSQLPDFLREYIEYMQAEPERYRTALNTYLQKIDSLWMSLIYEEGMEENAAPASADGMESESAFSREDWDSMLDELTDLAPIFDEMEESEVLQQFADSYYKEQLSRAPGEGYRTGVELEVVSGGETLFTISAATDTVQKSANLAAPQPQMSGDEIRAIFSELDQLFNPISHIEFTWEDDSDWNYALAEAWSDQRNPIWSPGGGVYVEYEDRDGQLDVCLNDIGELLGGSFGWNETPGEAYIVQAGETIPLKGYMKDGCAWIPVRELEKLGFSLAYQKDGWGGNQITLSR